MTPKEIAGIVANPRLSNEAVRLILFVAAGGCEPQEIEADELRIVLDCKTDRKVYAARDRAVREGYLEWSRGGRSHSNLYRYTPRLESAKKAESTDESAKKAESSPPIVVEEGSNTLPPIVPPVKLLPLADDARSLIESERETLGECVKPLVSYLRRRVAPESQEPYVGRVLGALGPDAMNPRWTDSTGAQIPLKRRKSIMAEALNELATADEKHGRKHGQGDWNNLRNKLLGIIQAENAPPPDFRATGTDGQRSRAGPRDQPADSQTYTPTEKLRWKS